MNPGMREESKQVRPCVWFLTILLAGCVVTAYGQVDIPPMINYQGKLTNPSDGTPVTPGVYHIEFRIWGHPTSEDASYAVWGRSFPVHVVTNGLFNILITDDGAELTDPVPLTNDIRQAFQGADRYLGLKITQGPGGSISAPEISPRQRLVSAPYAMHAQNSTEAYHAELADDATLAQDSDKLGGVAASSYYNDGRFDALGLHTTYLSVLGWEDGGSAHVTSLYDYWGQWCFGGPQAPESGVKVLVADGDLHADEDVRVEGAIRPSAGTTGGIHFPDDAYGGSGDKASITYYADSGEECVLKIAVENDPTDSMYLESSGDIGIEAAGGLLLKGDVKSMGGVAYHGETTDVDYTADCDCFFFVYLNNARCDVDITIAAGGTWSMYLRSNRDDDWNVSTATIPLAMGDRIYIHNVGKTDGAEPGELKVWRRDLGRATP